MDRDGSPLPGVTITILNHPEFGQTLSRADGMFDMAVNGGGYLTVDYQKSGFFPGQRQVKVPWQDYASLPDVILIAADPQVTTVDLTSDEPIQVARGTVQTDADGSRQVTILFPQGTQATMAMPDGSTRQLASLNVRATEYTVGPNGPKMMPAELPPTTAYTYAVELSVDEAVEAGAQTVRFSQTLYFYVENFLNFPVGEVVPVGYYDRQKGQWIPSDNGRVISVVSIQSGMAELDMDGDGLADGGGTLAITDQERRMLATLYSPGQSLWRVPVTHFSPYDCNWPPSISADAINPNGGLPQQNSGVSCPYIVEGSVIECQNQVLGESIPVTGTPYSLNYRSDRAPWYKPAYTVTIPLSGETLPPSVQYIELVIEVAGTKYSERFPAMPNQKTTFVWDGRDSYGRRLQGFQPIRVGVGYAYEVFRGPAGISLGRLFGVFGAFPTFGVGRALSPSEPNVTLLWQWWNGAIGTYDQTAPPSNLGGWSLDVHHFYDPKGQTLYEGNGKRRSAAAAEPVITTIAGNGRCGESLGDGGPATEAYVCWPHDVAVADSGVVYIVDNTCRVRRVTPDGVITTVAGTSCTYSADDDGGPATDAALNHPVGMALGRDGSMYIAEHGAQRIRRVGPDGIITTVAGNGQCGEMGDGGLATLASVCAPHHVALGPEGSLYFTHARCYAGSTGYCPAEYIRRVSPDGTIRTVVGEGACFYADNQNCDGLPAKEVAMAPHTLRIAPDGSIYVSNYSRALLLRIGVDGIVSRVVGGGDKFPANGETALDVRLWLAMGFDFGPDGSVYQSDSLMVIKVSSDGTVTRFAGNGNWQYAGEGGPATQAALGPHRLAVGPDGNVYIADPNNHRVLRVAPAFPGITAREEIAIPSTDASEVYVFTGKGRHLRTLDALTGAPRYSFSYNAAGQLAGVTDGEGNTTTVERDTLGNVSAIVAPFGQRTVLQVDAAGRIASISNPGGDVTAVGYSELGQLDSFTDPRSNTTTMTYDAEGLLTRHRNPAGGAWIFTKLPPFDSPDISVLGLSTRMERITTFTTERMRSGELKLTRTLPDRTQTITESRADTYTQTTLPDGTVATINRGPDPVYGMLAPLTTSAVLDIPNGLKYAAETTRTATLGNENHPARLSSLTERTTINSRVFTTGFDVNALTMTYTTPSGRQTTEVLDAKGRVIETRVPGIEPVKFTYDANGRLSSALQGSRTISLAYDTRGNLSSITDPLLRTVSFDYDLAERVTQQTFPDARDVNFDYDQNGNLTSLTPPGRPSHGFTHNEVNMQVDYVPPAISQGPSTTTNSYNLDKEPTTITRPDGSAITFGYNPAGKLNSAMIGRGQYSFTYNATTGQLESIISPGSVTLTYARSGFLLTGATWTGGVGCQ